jgi:hypothetical protein
LLDVISDCPDSISHSGCKSPGFSCHASCSFINRFCACKKVCLCNVPTKQKMWLSRVSPLAKQKHGHLLFFVGFRTGREKIAGLFILHDLFKHMFQ